MSLARAAPVLHPSRSPQAAHKESPSVWRPEAWNIATRRSSLKKDSTVYTWNPKHTKENLRAVMRKSPVLQCPMWK
ncbi:hypothetical protein NDU88_001721 [Pleurodeles waltl]|uniref:Uncharacterized protein n=1 Tax=Pleurodeles waltl TaxID=8319 RepID=A0AAV7TJU9_PLEWA|nr:hypothetical protein NDU88_001721 [Pleurodeles waltl]